MAGVAVGCMCITGSGLSNMVNCLHCNALSRFDLQLLETWIMMCKTVKESGTGAAVACWNTDERPCIPADGVPLPSYITVAASGASTGTATFVDSATNTATSS